VPGRYYRPTSPGRRVSSVADFSDITKTEPERSLTKRLTKTGGRNCQGKITAPHRGGGHKRLYRKIDFRRDKDNIPAKVAAIEYDPNRSARIALLHYADGEKRYILAPEGLQVGSTVMSGEKAEPNVGNSMPLANIPVGLIVHNVELYPGQGGQIARSAGAAVTLSAREGDQAHLILRSGETRRVHVKCRATIGRVGNVDHNIIRWGKAGRTRYLGRRPHVRGTAQNPISHPMGGGEGRTGGGRHPCSRTGLLAKGLKTRKRRAVSSRFIVRRRSKGR
jgi:large subunit ribosomal protein L2